MAAAKASEVGIDCAHGFFPFFPGIMEPLDPKHIPDEDDNAAAYELSQRQRQCERNVRQYQTRANTYKAGGITDEAKRNEALASKWRAEARAVAKERGGAVRADRMLAEPVLAK